jgi:hypothetical protein
MGGFIALIHAIGALKPFKERPVLNITNSGVDGCQNPPISGCETQLTIPRIIFPT